MFKVEVESLEAYFDFDPARRAELEAFDAVMRAHAPSLTRHFHAGTPAGEPGMRFKMIGYGPFHYPAPSGKLVAWPVVGLALQKAYISAYISLTRNGAPVLDAYAPRLRALRHGRNNFSFERVSDLDQGALTALVADIAAIYAADPENPVRARAPSRKG